MLVSRVLGGETVPGLFFSQNTGELVSCKPACELYLWGFVCLGVWGFFSSLFFFFIFKDFFFFLLLKIAARSIYNERQQQSDYSQFSITQCF